MHAKRKSQVQRHTDRTAATACVWVDGTFHLSCTQVAILLLLFGKIGLSLSPSLFLFLVLLINVYRNAENANIKCFLRLVYFLCVFISSDNDGYKSNIIQKDWKKNMQCVCRRVTKSACTEHTSHTSMAEKNGTPAHRFAQQVRAACNFVYSTKYAINKNRTPDEMNR